MKKIVLALIVGLFAGCSSLGANTFENRIVCTVANDRAFFLSLYGPIGVGSPITSSDAAAFCTPRVVVAPLPPQ